MHFFKRSIHRHGNRGVLKRSTGLYRYPLHRPRSPEKKKRSEWMGKWGTVWMKSGIVNPVISPPPPPFQRKKVNNPPSSPPPPPHYHSLINDRLY